MQVLIVDDNPDDRALVKHAVRDVFPEAEVREATDEAGFAALVGDGSGISLVVTDYELRWSNGQRVLERVKAARPDLPVIMFTGSGSEEVAVAAMKAGLDDYVVKSPRGLPRLAASVRAVVEAARGRAALARTEATLREALRHKELLLAELNHRVKNNLQAAISLLRLRARRHPEARPELLEVVGRLQALAHVQDRLEASDGYGSADVAAVLKDVVEGLGAARGSGRVGARLSVAAPLVLPVRRATPLALVVYEVVLNALKHAFQGREAGEVLVSLAPLPDGRVEIAVDDDGVGMDPAVVGGTSWALIRGLMREAEGEILAERRPAGGTRVMLRLAAAPAVAAGG